MFSHKYFNFLFIFVYTLITISTARIPIGPNSKREAASNIITEEIVETHTQNLVPDAGLPFQPPPVFLAPRPLSANIEQWRTCNMWCRLRVFLNERGIITREFLNREIVIKNIYGSQKIPGLFVYNSLLKRQKDIASRTNQLQKATELTAHLYGPLFSLLQFLLPQFGPHLSPVLGGRIPPPPGPPPPPPPPEIPRGPLPEPVLIPKGSPFPLPRPILTPKGPISLPQPILDLNGQIPHPALTPNSGPPPPAHISSGPLPQQPLPLRGPTGPPFPPGGYFQNALPIPTPQPLIGHGAHIETVSTTRAGKNIPIPAPPLPSLSATPLPIPPQPNFDIHPPPFITEEISEVIVVPPTPLARAFSPTIAPTKLSRGESGIVVTTVLPPSSITVTTTTTTAPNANTTTAMPK